MKFQMLKPKEAVKLARSIMASYGFMEISKSTDSIYFKKKGINFKVRLSDHKSGKSQYPDVALSVVFDYDTIRADVETRIKRASESYDALNRNMNRKK